jgi:hypothetical protein
MRSSPSFLASTRALVITAIVATTATAQDEPFAVSTVEGRTLRGRLESAGPEALKVVPPADGRAVTVPLALVLGVHGRPPRPSGSVRVHLVGGDLLTGDLRAGDTGGETFVVRSGTLGDVAVAVDRLARITFVERAVGAGAQAFGIPVDTAGDEGLFRRAERGFDLVLGALHRFGDDAVLFAAEGRDEPRPVPYAELAAIALRDGFEREEPATAMLVTRTGDRVGVDFVGYDDGAFRFRLEGGREARVDAGEVSALTFFGPGRLFLSDLPLEAAVERSYFAEGDEPLHPHRRDRSVTGRFLVAGGRTFAKGLGVHSRSALAWRVPEGVRHFRTLVGVDDEVLDLEVRGVARVAVRLDDEVLFDGEVRSGTQPHDLGRLAVRPGAVLTLEVDFGSGLDLGDRVDWLQAVFLK